MYVFAWHVETGESERQRETESESERERERKREGERERVAQIGARDTVQADG